MNWFIYLEKKWNGESLPVFTWTSPQTPTLPSGGWNSCQSCWRGPGPAWEGAWGGAGLSGPHAPHQEAHVYLAAQVEPGPAGRRQEQRGVGRGHGHLSFLWVLLSYFQSYQGQICTGQRPGSVERLVVTVTRSAPCSHTPFLLPSGASPSAHLGAFVPLLPQDTEGGPSECGRRAWQEWRAGDRGAGPLCRGVLPAGLRLTWLPPPGSLAPGPTSVMALSLVLKPCPRPWGQSFTTGPDNSGVT